MRSRKLIPQISLKKEATEPQHENGSVSRIIAMMNHESGWYDCAVAPIAGMEDLSPYFPAERLADLSRVSNPALIGMKRASWSLLTRLLLQHGFDPLTMRWCRTEAGRWMTDSVFVSLSHTDHFAAAAISDQPVGIDIEEETVFAKRIASLGQERFIRRITVPDEDAAGLTAVEIWTRKEALFKAYGDGAFEPSRWQTSRKDVTTQILTLPENVVLSLAGAAVRSTDEPHSCRL